MSVVGFLGFLIGPLQRSWGTYVFEDKNNTLKVIIKDKHHIYLNQREKVKIIYEKVKTSIFAPFFSQIEVRIDPFTRYLGYYLSEDRLSPKAVIYLNILLDKMDFEKEVTEVITHELSHVLHDDLTVITALLQEEKERLIIQRAQVEASEELFTLSKLALVHLMYSVLMEGFANYSGKLQLAIEEKSTKNFPKEYISYGFAAKKTVDLQRGFIAALVGKTHQSVEKFFEKNFQNTYFIGLHLVHTLLLDAVKDEEKLHKVNEVIPLFVKWMALSPKSLIKAYEEASSRLHKKPLLSLKNRGYLNYTHLIEK